MSCRERKSGRVRCSSPVWHAVLPVKAAFPRDLDGSAAACRPNAGKPALKSSGDSS